MDRFFALKAKRSFYRSLNYRKNSCQATKVYIYKQHALILMSLTMCNISLYMKLKRNLLKSKCIHHAVTYWLA